MAAARPRLDPCSPQNAAARPVLTRRSAVGRGMAATLAASRLLAPSLFVGCSLGIPPRSPTAIIGLLHSQTGPLAIGSSSVRDVELFAIERINAGGGLLGHQLEAKAPDTRSRTELFAKRATQLLDNGALALFGCWTSSGRKAVLPVVEERDSLLFYPVQYEGNESSRNIVYGNSLPNQHVLPAIDWLMGETGGSRRKFFLLGSDYLYPRTTNFIVKKYLSSKDITPVGEAYYPLDYDDFRPVVQQIVESGADCVLNTINGAGNIALLAALFAEKVDPANLAVLSTSIAEDDLRAVLPAHAVGQLAVSSYFQSLDTPVNRKWVNDFRDDFGADRVTGDAMESAWCLIHLWKQAVEKAGSFAPDAVRQVFGEGLEFAGPGGTIRLDPRTQHCTKYLRIGRARRDRQFDIVHTSDSHIDPDPYPAIAFPGWKCDWTRGGVERGSEVTIDGDV